MADKAAEQANAKAEKAVKVKLSAKRKDINFFALRKTQKKKAEINIPPWVWSILIPAVTAAVIASVYIYNQSAIVRLERELAASELQIEHANVDKQRPYMAKKTSERDILATYKQWITTLNDQFGYYKTVQSAIPDSIMAAADKTVTIVSFSAADEKLTINGTAESWSQIAEFQRKCMEIEEIDNAFVPSISKKKVVTELDNGKEETSYEFSFSLNSTFKSHNSMMKEDEE